LQEDLAAYYASSDLFVFPSQTEAFGNVTLEALASGIPVLAFDCAAARDWVQPNVNGWLVAENNPEGFAAQAVEIFKSPKLFQDVTASTRQQVVHLDWSQIAEQVETVLWDAIRIK
jgi:glycosyltransferase involved in cell wall biosynthesis